MHHIANLAADIQARITDELDGLISERSTARAILESRSAELVKLRDAEIKRIEQSAEQQKAMIKDVFGAIISENQADIERCDLAISTLGGWAKPVSISRQGLRTVSKPATVFSRAAE